MKIKKAIFPAAGLGTRFLPATKAQPKEMIPLIDKPCIQYVIEEAVNSGIEDVIIIIGRGKDSIINHFDKSIELESFLEKNQKNDLLETVQDISDLCNIYYVRQKEPLGLGHAINVGRNLIGNEPFAVLLGDDIILSKKPALKQLIEAYEKLNSTIIAVQEVPLENISAYGVISGQKCDDRTYKIDGLVEKPPKGQAPSNLAIIGRYILTPEIFEFIDKTEKDSRGEIQLTNALKLLLEKQNMYAYNFEGERFDTGTIIGYLNATVKMALKRKDIRDDFINILKSTTLYLEV